MKRYFRIYVANTKGLFIGYLHGVEDHAEYDDVRLYVVRNGMRATLYTRRAAASAIAMAKSCGQLYVYHNTSLGTREDSLWNPAKYMYIIVKEKE